MGSNSTSRAEQVKPRHLKTPLGTQSGRFSILPYKYVERRVVRLMVAIPIVFVTSWILYKRLALGEEKRVLSPEKTEKVFVLSGSRDDVWRMQQQEKWKTAGADSISHQKDSRNLPD